MTRGDQPEQMARILESLLPYDEVIVWDNSQREDRMVAGRFAAMAEARNRICYTQDDDTLVPPATQLALLDAWQEGYTVAVYGHHESDGGYGTLLPLVCGGGLFDRDLAREAMENYDAEYGWGRDEEAYVDFLVGVQIPFIHIHEPFQINMPVAQHPSRLCNQPWAADAKRRVTDQALAIT